MILSSIYAAGYCSALPKPIQRAVDYLKENDFTQMDVGVYEIQGKEIFAQVMDATTGPVNEKRPETHRKYIDVQYLASGSERQGFTPNTGVYPVLEAHDDRDLYFYEKVENESFFELTPGSFCVYYPWDIHRPAVMKDQPMVIRKVVVKVALSLLNA